MNKLREKIKILAIQSSGFLKKNYLPIALIFVFILQNHFFNAWLDIPVRPFFIRRTIVNFSLGVLIFLPAVLLKKWVKYLYLILSSILTGLIFVLQFLYYSFSGGFLQSSALFYASEGTTILDTVKTLLTYHLIFFAIGLLIILLAWILEYKKITSEKILNKKEKIFVGIAALIITFSGYGYIFLREYTEAGTTAHIYEYSKLYNVNALVGKIGVINFSIGDILTLGLHTDKATAADIDFVKKYKAEQTNTATSTNFGILKNRNLILIQIESLENAVIGQKINNQAITPNLNRLSNEGVYFSNYYAPIGPGTTADAEFMTLNSLYSLPDTVAFIEYAYNNYSALPGLLKENGYHTYAFHGDVPSFWNRANMYPQLGYEKWFGREDYIIPRKIGVYDLGDKDFFEQSIPKLKSLPQPFMATLITLTSHSPFKMPDDLKTINFPATTTLNELQQDYIQSIRYTDQAVGDFIEQLKSAGLYENSLILIYGDHSSFSKISSALKVNNSIFADLQTTQVPMIIIAPKTKLKGQKNIPSSHMDVYPTVANLLGFRPATNIFGHDMLDKKNHLAISRNLISGTIASIVTDNLAYHSASDGAFEHGTCIEMPNQKKISVDNCRTLYENSQNRVRASDLMVKGNMVTTPK